MNEPLALSADDMVAKHLSAMLLDAVEAARCSIPDDEAVRSHSPLIRLYQEASKFDAERHVAQSLRYARLSFLSACDHAQGFGSLLENPNRPDPALFTLARGTFEAAARCSWLIDEAHIDAHLHRFLSIRWDDLRFAIRFEDSVEDSEGTPVDVRELRAQYESEGARLGLEGLKQTNNTILVQTLLDKVIPSQNGRKNYSVYSAVAHGQLSALDSLVSDSDLGSISGFEASLPALTSLASGQALVALHMGYKLRRWIGGPDIATDHLDRAKARMLKSISALPEGATAASPSACG